MTEDVLIDFEFAENNQTKRLERFSTIPHTMRLWLRVLQPNEFLVWYVLKAFCEKNSNKVFPKISHNDWGQYCGVSSLTFSKSVKKLEKFNLIFIYKPKYPNAPDQYYLKKIPNKIPIEIRTKIKPFSNKAKFTDNIFEKDNYVFKFRRELSNIPSVKIKNSSEYINVFLNPNNPHLIKFSDWSPSHLRNIEYKLKDKKIIHNYISKLDYKIFLQTPYWKIISNYLKTKSGNVCEKCNSKKHKNELNIHHSTYKIKGIEIYCLDYLYILCENCHKTIHNIKG